MAARMKRLTFDAVREIGLKLPRTAAATAWGSPALTVDGQRFACMAIHKSAEPNSLVLHMDIPERDDLIEAQPDIYYIADHYINYPCVLVRLARVDRDTLEDLLRMAHRFVTTENRQRRAATTRSSKRGPSSSRT